MSEKTSFIPTGGYPPIIRVEDEVLETTSKNRGKQSNALSVADIIKIASEDMDKYYTTDSNGNNDI